MKSVVNDTDDTVRVAEDVTPEVKHQDEVWVKIISSDLCGPDLFRISRNGTHHYPVTLGHESSSYIDAVRSGADDLHPGDVIACMPLLPCFTCSECLKEFYFQYAKCDFIGSRRDGGLAKYVAVKQKNVFVLPAGMSIEDGTSTEPVTVGLHALHLAQGCENKDIIIIDAGTIGLLAIQYVVALGAKSVTVIDIGSEKLVLAKSFDAMQTFNSLEMSAPQMQGILRELRFNQFILRTAGIPQTVELTVEIIRPRAQPALVDTLHQDLHLTSTTSDRILCRELTVTGSWINCSSPWPGQEQGTASQLLMERKLSLGPLIAHCGDFGSFTQAVRDIAHNAMPGKVLLIP